MQRLAHPADDRFVLIEWVCESCGYGATSRADIVDEIQCPMCGEPVVPVANGAAGN